MALTLAIVPVLTAAAGLSVSQFKEILDGRVVVERVQFIDHEVAPPVHVATGVNPEPEKITGYFGRWQRDAHYLEMAFQLSLGRDLQRRAAWGLSGTSSFFVDASGITEMSVEELRQGARANGGAAAFGMVQTNMLMILRNAVHLGMGVFVPGSVRWDGVKFKARMSYGAEAEGELETDSDGTVRSVRWAVAGYNVPVVVSFEYDRELEMAGFPTRISRTAYFPPNNEPKPQLKIEILEISASPEDLPQSRFSPSNFGLTHVGNEYFFKDGELYFRNTAESNHVELVWPHKDYIPQSRVAARWSYLLLMLAVPLAVILVRRAIRTR